MISKKAKRALIKTSLVFGVSVVTLVISGILAAAKYEPELLENDYPILGKVADSIIENNSAPKLSVSQELSQINSLLGVAKDNGIDNSADVAKLLTAYMQEDASTASIMSAFPKMTLEEMKAVLTKVESVDLNNGFIAAVADANMKDVKSPNEISTAIRAEVAEKTAQKSKEKASLQSITTIEIAGNSNYNGVYRKNDKGRFNKKGRFGRVGNRLYLANVRPEYVNVVENDVRRRITPNEYRGLISQELSMASTHQNADQSLRARENSFERQEDIKDAIVDARIDDIEDRQDAREDTRKAIRKTVNKKTSDWLDHAL